MNRRIGVDAGLRGTYIERMHRWIVLLLGSAPLLVASAPRAQEPEPSAATPELAIRLPLRRAVLRNGLTIVMAPDPTTPLVAVRLFYRVGSRNEDIGRTGMAHLFEHMMFNGAERYGPKQFDAVLERAGGSGNAMTTRDFTCYTTEVPPSSLPVVFDLEADRMASLRIDADILAREVQVVLEERRESLEDEPREVLDMLLQASLFEAHPYRWPVLGWRADVAAATVAECRAFYRTYYAPNDAVLALAGDFDPDAVLALARERFGGLAAGPPVPAVRADEPPREHATRLRLVREVPHATLLLGWQGPRARDADHAVVTLLQQVLAGGRASRLDRRLVQDERLATSVTIEHEWSIDAEPFLVRVELAPGKDAAAAERAVLDEIARLVEHGVPNDELARARTVVIAGLVRNLQTLGGRAFMAGLFEVVTGDHRAFLQLPAVYRGIDATRVRDVAARLLQPGTATTAVLLPSATATDFAPATTPRVGNGGGA